MRTALVLLALARSIGAATITQQPDLSLILQGPVTTIDQRITMQLAMFAQQYPQSSPPPVLNAQGTLLGVFNYPWDSLAVWAPLATDWTPLVGPAVYRYATPPYVPPVVPIPQPEPLPGVPEPNVMWIVGTAVLLWCANKEYRRA